MSILLKEKINTRNLLPIEEQDSYGLSHHQIFDFVGNNNLREGDTPYNFGYVFEVSELNKNALEKAFKTIINRHESLRTIFFNLNGDIKQKIIPYSSEKFGISFFDLRKIKNPSAIAEKEYYNEKMKIGDLKTEPLVKMQIFWINRHLYYITLIIEHIISDVWSINILKKELLMLYEAYSEGQQNPLKPLAIQLKDLTAWKNRLVNSERNIKYWELKKLDTSHVIDINYFYEKYKKSISLDSSETKALTKGLAYTFFIKEDLKNNLNELASYARVSVFGLLLGCLKILIFKLFNQKQILVSVVFGGRDKNEFKNLVANCSEIIFLFSQVDNSLDTKSFIQSVYKSLFSSTKYRYPWNEHEDSPFKDSWIFKINYFDSVIKGKSVVNNFDAKHSHIESLNNFTSYLTITEHDNAFQFECCFSPKFYTSTMMVYLFDQYLLLLKEIAKNTDGKIFDLTY